MASHKSKKINNDKYIENTSTLVKNLVGERSIRKTSEDTGVATSYISGIINKK